MGADTLEKFTINDAIPALQHAISDLEQGFQQHKNSLKEQFISSFRQICDNIRVVQQATQLEVGFLIYHLLRTHTLRHQYSYTVMVYNNQWYRSGGITVGEVDFSFFYEYYEHLWQQLLKESRKYVRQISEPDVEMLMLDLLDPFHKYVVELMRFSLLDALETEEYLELSKADRFEIQTGEYYELCDLIHIEQKQKNLRKIKKQLQESEGQACCFQDFREMNLIGLSSRAKDLRYADFRGSQLDEIDLGRDLLMGTKFRNCTMKDANLTISMLCDADFQNADLSGAKLQYSVAFAGKNKSNQWKQTGFTGVSFKNSCLKRADFTGATIIGGDFMGADLTDAIFAEAQLFRSRFTKEQLVQCEFSDQQLEQMEIIR